jgi:hypothetical protein
MEMNKTRKFYLYIEDDEGNCSLVSYATREKAVARIAELNKPVGKGYYYGGQDRWVLIEGSVVLSHEGVIIDAESA